MKNMELKIYKMKKFQKNCMPFIYESSSKGILGFFIYVNNRKEKNKK